MPHCIIEYTPRVLYSINKKTLLQTAHQVMADSGLFGAGDIKTRAHETCDYILGTQGMGESDFIHVLIYLLSGRTQEQKQALTTHMSAALRACLPQVAAITVDIRDMVRETYVKDML